MTTETDSLSHPCTSRETSSYARLLPDASSSPEELLTGDQPKSLMRCLVGGYGFRAICLMPMLGWSVWGARFYRNPGALSRTLCSCVAMACVFQPSSMLHVLVEAAGVRHLG